MNAQEIIRMLKKINRTGFQREYDIIPENMKYVDKIYELARQVEPCDKYRNGIDRTFWFRADKGSYEDFAETFVSHFTYIDPVSFAFSIYDEALQKNSIVDHEEMKKAWPEYFPDDTVWFRIYLAEHMGCRGISMGCMFSKGFIIDTRDKPFQKMDMSPLLKWIIEEEEKCIEMIRQGTYSQYIADNLPYEHRSGVTTLSTYWKYVPEDKENLFGNIDPDELKQFHEWDDNEDIGWKKMTANDYFRMCDSLYDILGLKEKYPLEKKDKPGEPFTSKEYFMAYSAAIHYGPTEALLDLKGDSPAAFRKFVAEGFHDHTWDACLQDRIRLTPDLFMGKIYIRICFDYEEGDYPLLIHMQLELRKRGYPILKRTDVEKYMSGKRKISITPYGDDFDWKYEFDNKIRTEGSRSLPRKRCNALIKKIKWFPTGEWAMAVEDKK